MKHVFSVAFFFTFFVSCLQAAEVSFVELKGHTHGVDFAAFSPDGKKVVTICRNDGYTSPPDMNRMPPWGSARIWDADSGKELCKLEGDVRQILSVGFSPDGTKIIATTSWANKVVPMWDADSGKELRQLENVWNQLRYLVFSSDGKKIITLNFSDTIQIFDADTGKELREFREGLGQINYATFSPVGMKMVTIGKDGVIHVWDADSGKELRLLEAQADSVKLHADYSQVPPLSPSFAFSPDGTKIVTTRGDILDVDSGKKLRQLEDFTKFHISFIAFSPDGKKIVMGNRYWGDTRLWDADSGKRLSELENLGQDFGIYDTVDTIIFSPDGKKVVTAVTTDDNGRYVQIWDAESGKELQKLDGRVDANAFSPDGKKMVTSNNGNTARIWTLE